MRCISRAWQGFVLCFLLTQTAIASETDELAEVLREAEKSWLVLKEFYNHVEATVVEEDVRIVGKHERSKVTYHFLAAYPFALHKRVDENGAEEVRGFNSKYFFQLRRPNNTSPFVLLHLGSPDPYSKALAWGRFGGEATLWLRDHEALFIDEWKSVPHFKWLSCSRTSDSRVVLTAQYRPPGIPRPPQPRPYDMELIVSPSLSWCIVHGKKKIYIPQKDGTLSEPFGHYYDIEYGERIGSVPIPKRMVAYWWSEDPQKPGLRTTTTFLSLVHRKADERDFTLSAFGLPEPPGVTWERPTPWWLYGILVGFALILVSGILYKVIRRLRTQAT
jgi:hypothetical protein